jgi:hypothetical protein
MRNLNKLILAACTATLAGCADKVVLDIPANKQVVLNRTGRDLTCQVGSGMIEVRWGPAFIMKDRGQWSRQPALPMTAIRCGPPLGEGYMVPPGKRLAYVVIEGKLDLINLK